MAPRETPPVSDTRWEEWSREFAKFLESPRSWDDLSRFAKKKGRTPDFARQVIAYLDLKGRLVFRDKKYKVR